MLLSDLDTVPALAAPIITRPSAARTTPLLTILSVKLDAPWIPRTWYGIAYDSARELLLVHEPRTGEIGFVSVPRLMALRGPNREEVTRDPAFVAEAAGAWR
jgi:hypothetical protein